MTSQIAGLRLSPQQQRLWTLQQDRSVYVAQCSVIIDGELDSRAIKAALDEIVERHEMLRTAFHRPAGIKLPIQVIQEQGACAWRQDDLRSLSQEQQETTIRQRLEQQRAEPFDFEHGPLLRTELLTLADQRHTLLITLPALCADAWTLKNLVQALSAGYAAWTQGRPAEDEIVQYADFSEWQHEQLGGEDAEAGKQFWQAQDIGRAAPVRLPFERSSVEDAAFEPVTFTLPLDPATTDGLDRLAQTYGSSLANLLLACWQTLLWRYTDQADIVVGVVCDGRKFDDLMYGLGLFAQSVPVRSHFAEQVTLRELLAQVDEMTAAAYEWQEFFVADDQADTSKPTASFEFNEWPTSYDGGAVTFTLAEQTAYSERFVVQLRAQRAATGLQLQLHADRTRLPRAALPVLADALHTLLRHALAAPATPLAALPLLSSAAAARLVVQRNRTARPLPEPSLLAAFAAQVVRTPAAPALHSQGQTRSFAQLETAANQLAHHLQAHGVGPDTLVALALPRTPTLVVALLAVLKAGGAYLPLDSSAPTARTAAVLAQAQVALVLTDAPHAAELPPVSVPVLQLDQPNPAWSTAPTSAPASTPQPEQLAYVLFTSGSTGQPKGVAVTHGGLLNYLAWARTTYLTPDGQGAPVHSPLSFDLTVTSLLVPLLGGQAVTLLDEEQPLEALAGALQPTAAYSLVKLTPAHLALLEKELPRAALSGSAHALVIGGEALQGEMLRRWQREAPATRLINEYGPTETVVGCCVYEVTPDNVCSGVVPIGRPIANTQMYVLDRQGQPVPVGVTGELYIGGAQVARGYLGQPALTAERFLPDPFSQQPGARLYRTGDLGRYSLDENLEFLGRNDHQVKIRSYRIELGEVEATLVKHAAVRDAVVSTIEDASGEQRLVAYVTLQSDSAVDANDLHQFLSEQLPWYMVPSDFLALDALPLTPNGKVDRRALPAPSQLRPMLKAAYTAPQTPVEQILADIWADVLDHERVGVHDSFFALGGDSIMSVRVVALAKERGLHFSVRQLFQHQTIHALAQHVTTTLDLAEPSQAGQTVDEDAELTRLLETLEGLSDEEVQRQLHERMQPPQERTV